MRWLGIIFTALPALVLTLSAAAKLARPPELIEQVSGHLGYPESAILWIGITEILCVVLYLVPRTSVLGAILATGYLGGAISAHVRLGENFLLPLILGIALWGGLFLRDARLRDLLPLREPAES